MGRAWRWWGVWACVVVCLGVEGRSFAECRDAGAKGRVWTPNALDQDWTWRDADGCVRTRAELEEVLAQNKLWVHGRLGEGHHADLRGATLNRADLTGADLNRADLTGTKLNRAQLIGADLSKADLTGADLVEADLTGADLTEATLYKQAFDAYSGADLRGVVYEPKAAPAVEDIARASGLDRLRYKRSKVALIALRKSFQDAGFVQQARKVTASLRRSDLDNNGDWWLLGYRLDYSLPALLNWALFDWTCEWGANWTHPLVLLGWLCLVCGPLYWVGMHFGRVGGIYQIELSEVVATKAAKELVTRVGVRLKWVGWQRLRTRTLGPVTRARPAGLRWRLMEMALRAEWRALRLAFLFSVLSALDIGFHEFNVGQWARMLLARDFNLKAPGWMRVAGGVQSLVGLGLVALLSYFGHPFE